MPPLGGLPSLKFLLNISARFYTGSTTFPALEELKLENMKELRSWEPSGTGVVDFPKVPKLTLRDCPVLRELLPTYLTCLLEITRCPELECSFEQLHAVVELKLSGCDNMDFGGLAHLTSLSTLWLGQQSGNSECFTVCVIFARHSSQPSGAAYREVRSHYS